MCEGVFRSVGLFCPALFQDERLCCAEGILVFDTCGFLLGMTSMNIHEV